MPVLNRNWHGRGCVLEANKIIVDGRTLTGRNRFGVWNVNQPFTGWWDTPESKGLTVERSGADGEFDLPTFNRARAISITGLLRDSDHTRLHEAGEWFRGMLRAPARMSVSGHSKWPQWCTVKRQGSLLFVPVTDTVARFQAQLKAVDPRIFGAERVTRLLVDQSDVQYQNRGLIWHKGTYDATPTLTIRGNMPGGYRVSGPDGKRFTVPMPLMVGATHVIDMSHGLLEVNGVFVSDVVTDADKWTVPPETKSPIGIYPLATGVAAMDITLYDTFM